jgi:hypothetical protein
MQLNFLLKYNQKEFELLSLILIFRDAELFYDQSGK